MISHEHVYNSIKDRIDGISLDLNKDLIEDILGTDNAGTGSDFDVRDLAVANLNSELYQIRHTLGLLECEIEDLRTQVNALQDENLSLKSSLEEMLSGSVPKEFSSGVLEKLFNN